MSSKLLYDVRDNSIKKSQTKPNGSAELPSFNSLCRSARIPEDEKEFMKTIVINENYLTTKAKEELRILRGKVVKKPKVNITTDKKEITISINPQFNITIEITNTIESDSFSTIQMIINDVEFTIDIINNVGNKMIELEEVDTYTIRCIDNRFVSHPAEVIAVA